jgi:hypothetical protein
MAVEYWIAGIVVVVIIVLAIVLGSGGSGGGGSGGGGGGSGGGGGGGGGGSSTPPTTCSGLVTTGIIPTAGVTFQSDTPTADGKCITTGGWRFTDADTGGVGGFVAGNDNIDICSQACTSTSDIDCYQAWLSTGSGSCAHMDELTSYAMTTSPATNPSWNSTDGTYHINFDLLKTKPQTMAPSSASLFTRLRNAKAPAPVDPNEAMAISAIVLSVVAVAGSIVGIVRSRT